MSFKHVNALNVYASFKNTNIINKLFEGKLAKRVINRKCR